ncbi:hypothetical protein COJ46_02445 [Bacillus sp. AFS077874]|uniref:AAA family ATPase n=1 Tax=Bacillus sp. AFS077874 TaxID=2033513 RepID=UPI000BF2C579|nr:AAA family ATPase [Bacillus sp. AFS077874]PFM82689.1 hypothetical protein COJ46_02445 [Bacillus sp. AFS077874]
MDFLEEIYNLKPGVLLSDEEIQEIFKCGVQGGMRRSLKTNSLVLISDKKNTLYKYSEKIGEIWPFVGMGRIGDQSTDYLQNKTLLRSNDSGIDLYFFRRELKDTEEKYTYVGKVLLADEPDELNGELDEKNNKRKVLVFPLIEVGKDEKIIDFLSRFSKYELQERGILEYSNFSLSKKSFDNLIELMEGEGIDTLTGPGGWFLSKTGFFYNPNTESKFKHGNITMNKTLYGNKIFQKQNKYLNPYFRSSIVYFDKDDLPENPLDKDDLSENPNEGSNSNILRIEHIKFNSDNIYEQIDIKLINGIERNNNPFSTLIIGPNGTGKSTILSIIQKVLLDLYYIAESKDSKSIFSTKNVNYEMSYYIGKTKYTVKRNNSKIELIRNDKIIGFNKELLPHKLIAVSYNINDKFTYQSNAEDVLDRYQYLGIKSSDNEAKIGETTRNLVQNIIISSMQNDFLKYLKNITDFINVEPKIRIIFDTAGNKSIINEINKENVESLQKKYTTNQKKLRKNNYLNIIEFQEIEDFIKNRNLNTSIFKVTEKSIIVDFDLFFYKEYEKFFDELNIIWHLYQIGIFKMPIVKLKKENFFRLEHASSGEAQYFSTMVNILAKIKPNSVILIDEPETSLHPNWQYKYIYGVNTIFEKFPSSHFIMASHSHFLISDLEVGSSSIISMDRKTINSDVEVKLHDEDTFGWAVEDVLFNIFRLPTNRNYYVADEIDKILFDISLGNVNQEKLEEIKGFKEIYQKMKKSDPLREVLELIFEKVGINV